MPNFTSATLAWTLPWDADWVTAVTFLGASRRIVAGNNLGHLLMWDLPEKAEQPAPKPIFRGDGHTNCVSRLLSAPDGKSFWSASYDHTIRVWNADAKASQQETLTLNARAIEDAERRKRNGAKVPPAIPATVGVVKSLRTLDAHKEWIVNMAQTPDGKTLLSGDDAGQVIVWNREEGTIRKQWSVTGWAYAVAIAPDAKTALVSERKPLVFDSGRHAGLKLWDTTTGTAIKDLAKDYKDQYFGAAAFSPDGKTLAIARGGEADGTNGGIIHLLDPSTGAKQKTLQPGHLNGATDVAFHPDGKHLATTGRDTVVRVWEIATGKQIAEIGKSRGGQFKDWLHALSFSADGNWLVTGDMAGAVQVWRL